MIRQVWRPQEGQGLVLLMGFMALAVPLVTAGLGLASSLSIDSRVKTGILRSQYSGMGGVEHALYRLVYESNYAESLPIGTPDSYVVTINDKNVAVTVEKISDPPPPPTVPGSESGRELRVEKNVEPNDSSTGVEATFFYEVKVINSGTASIELTTVYDLLPSGLSYVSGSTSGITTNGPQMIGNELKWEELAHTIPSEADATLRFQASATSTEEGVYCNEAWVDPGGQSKSTTGPTAKIVVGSPSSSLCPGAAAFVTKSVDPAIVPADTPQSFTYTILVQNTGAVTLHLEKLKDLLPEGLSYVMESSSGMSSGDPSVSNAGSREELTWTYSPAVIQPGETKTQEFRATAAYLEPGQYYNEVWATFSEFGYEYYTWPIAEVQAVGVFKTSATDGKTTVESIVWLWPSGHIIDSWEVK